MRRGRCPMCDSSAVEVHYEEAYCSCSTCGEEWLTYEQARRTNVPKCGPKTDEEMRADWHFDDSDCTPIGEQRHG